MNFDVIIVGAGAAGLIAAYKLIQNGQRVLILEQGENIYKRKHLNPFDVANGIGGAGLFSDGKISFYPSATNLWKLDKKELNEAYNFFQLFLSDFDINIPNFNQDWCTNHDSQIDGNNKKIYDSIVIDFATRLNIIYKLCDSIKSSNIITNSEVCKISKNHSYFTVTAIDKFTKEEMDFNSKAILMASGKHSYSFLSKRFCNIPSTPVFNKSEIGIRIECSKDDFDLYDDSQIDVKYIKEIKEKSEVRTFCCCRDGIVIESSSYGLVSLNGSSGEVNSNLCNIGITVRANKESRYNKEIQSVIQKKDSVHKVRINDFMEQQSILTTDLLDEEIRFFLLEYFPRMSKSKGFIYYPTYESVGEYPLLSNSLQIEKEAIWFAGDSTGLFRGLTPAFVSGLYSAQKILLFLESSENSVFEKFYIKKSKTNKYPVAFTAQSKLSFFCRDAVCEYVFKKGYIPVNPFRIFGYFLNDRVDRDIIRNGNNEMISRSDELWVFGSISDGVLFEIVRCKQLGIPIRFFNIATKADEIKEIGIEDLTFEPEIHSRKIKKEDLKNLVYGNLTVSIDAQLKLF